MKKTLATRRASPALTAKASSEGESSTSTTRSMTAGGLVMLLLLLGLPLLACRPLRLPDAGRVGPVAARSKLSTRTATTINAADKLGPCAPSR
jgi:hypothetical protein